MLYAQYTINISATACPQVHSRTMHASELGPLHCNFPCSRHTPFLLPVNAPICGHSGSVHIEVPPLVWLYLAPTCTRDHERAASFLWADANHCLHFVRPCLISKHGCFLFCFDGRASDSVSGAFFLGPFFQGFSGSSYAACKGYANSKLKCIKWLR